MTEKHLVRAELDTKLTKKFMKIKKFYGVKSDAEIVRMCINQYPETEGIR